MDPRAITEAVAGAGAGKTGRALPPVPSAAEVPRCADTLSVQVHPSDRHTNYLPAGETGKTEAWVVLEAGPQSRIYAGLKPATTADNLRRAIASKTVADHLAHFTPKPGDGVFVPAGTVHSLGDVVVFEVQQNSDVTFRLYDWEHIDAKTGRPRPLQVDQAMACIDFAQGAIGPVGAGAGRDASRCGESGSFVVSISDCGDSAERRRLQSAQRDTPRVLVCIAGEGQLEHDGTDYAVGKGDVLLLPAVVGACAFRPRSAVSLLELSLPEGTSRNEKADRL